MSLVQIVFQIPSTLGEADRNLFPKARANVKGISRHVAKNIIHFLWPSSRPARGLMPPKFSADSEKLRRDEGLQMNLTVAQIDKLDRQLRPSLQEK